MINVLIKTEQPGRMLETDIFAGVFLAAAEDNTQYSIESYSALKICVTVINTPCVFYGWDLSTRIKKE